ncbi:MAG TPA: tRNA (N6-threonylcarbamoyladenosine(37)-N6)-methyltransferase TrmO [Desulfobacteraceae bacterium]|mgnify:CR=1 FL=1|nr:tRNA (N6-threonylcarbamoyladenosine(37)-N6)-methyltransferase TrmO [Desulfobacteraceae bacterium]
MTKTPDTAYFRVRPVGVVNSTLKRRKECPRQGREGAPDAWLEIYPEYAEALEGIGPGSEILVLTWLHLATRDVLKVHPRGNPDNPLRGVFATRSPSRPNPVGLHRVRVLAVEEVTRIRVGPLEVLDGTPVIDIKPAFHRANRKDDDEPAISSPQARSMESRST